MLFHPTRDLLFSASHDKTARVWRRGEDGWAGEHVLREHGAEVTSVALQATGEYLVTAGRDGMWCMHDLETGRALAHARESGDSFECAAFHPDGLILGTSSADNTVKIWDVKGLTVAATFQGHTGLVNSISFSENGCARRRPRRDRAGAGLTDALARPPACSFPAPPSLVPARAATTWRRARRTAA